MIHIFKNVYLVPSASENSDNLTYETLYSIDKGKLFSFHHKRITEILSLHWRHILNDKSDDNLTWLFNTVSIDLELKSKNFKSTGLGELKESSLKLSVDDLSFEHILASYLLWPDVFRKAMKRKIELLSWEQIIQEISVIRYELNLLLFNRKINNFLPPEFRINHDEDIEIQIYNNPYINWIMDPSFTFSNIEYFKKHVNLEYVTHFYDSWVVERRPEGVSPEMEHEMDNLKWITTAIMRGEWEKLLDANLSRNFGCVYLDNTMIAKGNQVWSSMIIRDYNRNSQLTASKLALNPESKFLSFN